MTAYQITSKGNSFVQILKKKEDGSKIPVATLYIQEHIDACTLIGVTPEMSVNNVGAGVSSGTSASTSTRTRGRKNMGKSYENVTPPSQLQQLDAMATNLMNATGT